MSESLPNISTPPVTITPAPAGDPIQALLDDYDSDLPEGVSVRAADPAAPPAQPQRTRNERGQFVAQQPAPAETPEPAAPSPAAAHHPYFVGLARQLGFTDATIDAMPPAVLERVVADQQQRHWQSQQPAAPASAPVAADDAIDWGKDNEGNAFSEKDFPAHYVHAVKFARDGQKRIDKLERDLADERADRANARTMNALDRKFASRPDLYGQGRTAEMDANSPEFERRQAVLDNLRGRIQRGQHTTPERDWDRAHAVLGAGGTPPAPAPPAAPAPQRPAQPPVPGQYTREQWDAAALAAPTQQNRTERMGERERRIAEEEIKQRSNGVYQHAGPDADDDFDLL